MIARSALRRILLAALLVVPLSVVAAPASAAAAAPAGCSSVVFFGLRGSGELNDAADPEHQNLNMGETVYAVYEAFEGLAKGAGVRVAGVGLALSEYPATAALPEVPGDWLADGDPSLLVDWLSARSLPSVVAGSASLGVRLRPFLEGDRSTCVVLAGYSQGAWAINGNLMTNKGYVQPVLDRVSGVALLGDPMFDGKSSVARGGQGERGMLRVLPTGISLPGAGQYYDGYDQVQSYCSSGDPVCGFGGFGSVGHHLKYIDNGYTGGAAQFLWERVRSGAPATPAPRIEATDTYREGVLVYARVRFSGEATGFGFRGANGAGWAEESHPFTDPSYGRVSPGQVDYPFNLACGQSQQYESDVEFWLYGESGQSAPVTIHLRC